MASGTHSEIKGTQARKALVDFAPLHNARPRAFALLHLLSANAILAAVLVMCAVLLIFPLKLAIGGYYWDVFLYPDAAWRIANGQAPHLDFFAPAGALGYYLYAALEALFPNGQQLLLAQWSLLIVSLPLMAAMTSDLERQGRSLALAIVLPFVFLSIVPINSKEVYPLAGVDGFGIYNRQSCVLLYVLMTALVFLPSGRKLALIVGTTFAALFFIKVTAALTALPLIAVALLSGRLEWRHGAQAGALFVAICALIELPTGLVSAYIRDIGILVGMNAGGLFGRLRSPVVMYLDILVFFALLSVLLLWVDRKRLLFVLSPRAGMRMRSRIAAIFGHDAVWISTLALTGIFFETQNTGSLAFVFAWPLLAQIFARWFPRHRDRRTAVLLLVALAVLPMAMPMLHRTVRVTLASIFYDELSAPALGKFGQVEAKSEFLERAHVLKEHFAQTGWHHRKLSEAGHQTSYLLYSEIDYQLSYLVAADEAVKALQTLESEQHRRFDRLIVLDFVDIFTPLLRRWPVRLISIGMAAERTVPPLDEERLKAAKSAQAVLVPRCPATPVRLSLKKTFEPLLEEARLHRLTACWDLYIRS